MHTDIYRVAKNKKVQMEAVITSPELPLHISSAALKRLFYQIF